MNKAAQLRSFILIECCRKDLCKLSRNLALKKRRNKKIRQITTSEFGNEKLMQNIVKITSRRISQDFFGKSHDDAF